MPRTRSAACSSSVVSDSTPSHMMSLSSLRSCRSLVRSWKRRTGSGAKAGRPMNSHRDTSCRRDMTSSVRWSLKWAIILSVSSRVTASPPSRTRRIKSRSSSAELCGVPPSASLASFSCLLTSLARSSRVCSSTWAIPILTLRSLIRFSSRTCPSSNVDGSRLGKRRMAKGSANSMKGTSTKKASGITRSRSDRTRTSRLCSRRESVMPRSIRISSCEAILVSAASSLVPCQ
mmetsp:Transcript_15444/g.50410  ORF Transcript_15444/g.50410 Transcript_15444/m.50410 type:complete len:232 (-) Transcript_15444:308-1003(-)